MNVYLLSVWCIILSLVIEVTNPSTSFVRDRVSTTARHALKHDGPIQKNIMKTFAAEQQAMSLTQSATEDNDDDIMGESILYVLLLAPLGLLHVPVFLLRFNRNNAYTFNLRPVLNKPPVGWM